MTDFERRLAALEEESALHRKRIASLETQLQIAREQDLRLQASMAVLRFRISGAEPDGAPTDVGPSGLVSASPPSSPENHNWVVPLSVRRSPGRMLLVTALAQAGRIGMSGRELNEVVLGAGMHLDTSEKAKAFLKHAGIVGHDAVARRWFFAGQGPDHVEADRLARAAKDKDKNG